MATQNLLALSVFLAVSSATLLIYLAFSRLFARPRPRGGDLGDPEHDPFFGPASFKSPATGKPMSGPPAVSRVGGEAWGLSGLVAFVATVLVLVCLGMAGHVLIRQRFEQVAAKITSDKGPGIGVDGNRFRAPDFRTTPIPGAFFPPDGLRGIGTPTGFGAGGGFGASPSVPMPVGVPAPQHGPLPTVQMIR